VDDSVSIDVSEANPTVRVRSKQLDDIVRDMSTGRGRMRVLKAPVKRLLPRRARRGALDLTRRRLLYGEPNPPEEAVMVDLRRRFKDEVIATSDYLKRDLVSLWGYDSID
jgi:hypothetical protein